MVFIGNFPKCTLFRGVYIKLPIFCLAVSCDPAEVRDPSSVPEPQGGTPL